MSEVPSTKFASSYQCISALKSGFSTCFASQKSGNGSYMWAVLLSNLIKPCYSLRFIASNGYERLTSLKTPVSSSFFHDLGFLHVSPHRSQSVTTNISYWSLCSVFPAVPPTIFAAFYLCFSAIMSGSGSFVCSGIPSDMSKHC
ncbi:hypothetical protein T07_9620 [Trichinella nelsoni]|uniref:Uncharacterized protein n=1 Tax=Trichinella nelsoni TaxID=6336 RepID=A0A0V0RID5_9BILA|nr:hypothetical protein T07_9620 [Trichinella nelsoni]